MMHSPFSCWWWWMDWRKNGHALSQQNMWQTTTDPGGVQQNLATKLNSTVWFGALKFENFLFSCWNESTDSKHVIMQYIKPHKSRGKWKLGMTSRMLSANSQSPLLAKWNTERRCTLQDCQNFSHEGAHSFVIDYDETLAKLVVMLNLQREWGKDVNFQPVSIEMELQAVTFEPVSIEVMNLIVQAWFRFLNFTLFTDSLSIVSIVENMSVSTWHTGFTSVRQNWNLCVIDPQLCVTGNTVIPWTNLSSDTSLI